MSSAVRAADIDVGGHASDGSAFRTLGLVSGRPFRYDEPIAPLVEGMSDEHRFLLDLNGFVLLDGALSDSEVRTARAAVAEHSAATPPKPELWCWNKDLEKLVFHRSFWSILMELTNGKVSTHLAALSASTDALRIRGCRVASCTTDTRARPAQPKMKGAQFINDDPAKNTGATNGKGGGHLHCARTDFGPESATFYQERGELRCNDMIVFIYLTAVEEGDGGLAVRPRQPVPIDRRV
jgi:hypothetical protein